MIAARNWTDQQTQVATDAEDGDERNVAVGIYGDGGEPTVTSRFLPAETSDDVVADALVRCLVGTAAQHGGASLVAAVYARMRQEVTG